MSIQQIELENDLRVEGAEMPNEASDRWQVTFRHQLILAEQKTVFDYWYELKKGRRMPSRGDVDPAKLKKHLPTILLFDVENEGGFRVRLAGTGIRDVLDEEITGKTLQDIDFGEHQSYWEAAHNRVVSEKRPAQGVAPVTWREKGNLFVFWLRLPLSVDDQNVNMVLGFDLYLAAAKVDALSRQNPRMANGS